jgi:hypothetical protein
MKGSRPLESFKAFASRRRESSLQENGTRVLAIADLKARQSAKIRQLGEALVASGYRGLDDQAKALGLSRSTTWNILKANHKSSGLSAAIINRMLAAPGLPPHVRLKIFEYIEEKSAGLYGDERSRVRKFAARIATCKRDRGSQIRE